DIGLILINFIPSTKHLPE
ncbi:hypothetical protein DOY81_003287, partial [Sarcophaga bullata]